jgi:hypothetical protein
VSASITERISRPFKKARVAPIHQRPRDDETPRGHSTEAGEIDIVEHMGAILAGRALPNSLDVGAGGVRRMPHQLRGALSALPGAA